MSKLTELQEHLEKLKTAIEYINGTEAEAKKVAENGDDVVQKAGTLITSSRQLEEAAKQLVNAVDKKFPEHFEKISSRIEKVDTSVATIAMAVQNLSADCSKIRERTDILVEMSKKGQSLQRIGLLLLVGIFVESSILIALFLHFRK